MAAAEVARTRLAVWGDPIAHSKSPALHAAAYDVLGLDWRYERRRVDDVSFVDALSALDAEWRGLSLTMPLKEVAFRATAARDMHAALTGAVNTVLLGDGIRGFNTDVGGIIDALAEHGLSGAPRVRILGAGATAASALVATAESGARAVEVRSRRPERGAPLIALGERLGVGVSVAAFDDASTDVDLTVATLPSGTALPEDAVERLSAAGGALFDAAYAPWPSSLAGAWQGTAVSGLGMLLHQAVRQIRIFHHGTPTDALPNEPAVLAAMRAALADAS